jgi:ribulose-5-phosphate 4-epimerase/fuculose-1-phosphate aldolase
MADNLAQNLANARHELAVANRIVAHEGIIDAFGHVSMRHPAKPDRYLISRSRSPEVVEASDIYEYTLDSEPVTPLPAGIRGYGELVIHGEIYKARPDVNAVAHHHSMAFLPFCNSGEELVPLYHMGAQIGEKVPFWDSKEPHRAGVPQHLQRAQRRAAVDLQGAGPAVEPAHAGRGEDGLGPQSRAAAAGARLGILVDAAEEGRRISGGHAEGSRQARVRSPRQAVGFAQEALTPPVTSSI